MAVDGKKKGPKSARSQGTRRSSHNQVITRRWAKPERQQLRGDQVATATERDLNTLLQLRAAAVALQAQYVAQLVEAAASGAPLEHVHQLHLLAQNQARLADFFGVQIAGVTL